MRNLKTFYFNNYKKLYQQFLDYLLQLAVPPADTVKVPKKEVFKLITEQGTQNVYNSFVLLALLHTQLLQGLQSVEQIVKEALGDFH